MQQLAKLAEEETTRMPSRSLICLIIIGSWVLSATVWVVILLEK